MEITKQTDIYNLNNNLKPKNPMKKFYPALMLSAVAMTGLNASAEKPNWEHQGSW